jgi:HAMP domain-containing protein
VVANTSPAGDEVQLAAGHVGATVEQLERRIDARFGERGLTKAARDLGHLVVLVQSEADQSRDRLRRTTLAARATGLAIVAATLVALAFSLRSPITHGLPRTADWVPLVESIVNDVVFVTLAVLFLWAFPERLERRSLLRMLHRLRSLAHVIDMHQLSKDPEQVSPGYVPTAQSIRHGLDADQLRHYLGYCSEMLSLTAKTAALCAEHSTDAVVLETVSYIETLTTELSNKIWQKISLLP